MADGVIITHLGVGDGIIQSGLAISLLERYEHIAFPTYQEYLPTFESIFAGEPRISVYPVPRLKFEDYGSPREVTYNKAIETASLNNYEKIKLGVYSGRGLKWDFTKSFYEDAGIDYSMRWRACPITQAWQSVPQMVPSESLNGQRKIFLHDDVSRGFVIQRQRLAKGYIVAPLRSFKESILAYANYLIDCDEIHVIDSAFFWLADSLPTKAYLFLHRYPRWQRPRDFRYETYRHWNYVD